MWSFVNCANERVWYTLVGILLTALNPWGLTRSATSRVSRAPPSRPGPRIIASLVDPRKAPLVMGAPSIKDLAAIANNVRLVGFDNVSMISRSYRVIGSASRHQSPSMLSGASSGCSRKSSRRRPSTT